MGPPISSIEARFNSGRVIIVLDKPTKHRRPRHLRLASGQIEAVAADRSRIDVNPSRLTGVCRICQPPGQPPATQISIEPSSGIGPSLAGFGRSLQWVRPPRLCTLLATTTVADRLPPCPFMAVRVAYRGACGNLQCVLSPSPTGQVRATQSGLAISYPRLVRSEVTTLTRAPRGGTCSLREHQPPPAGSWLGADGRR